MRTPPPSRATELGGSVFAPAFDVMEAGRMAVLADPGGAVFAAWQPKDNPGAGLVNAHGALSLNQLNTRDPDAAVAFYSELFGWRFTKDRILLAPPPREPQHSGFPPSM